MKLRSKALAIAMLFVASAFSALAISGNAVAGTPSGTYTFSESGLGSGTSWSVKITDAGTLVTTVSGTSSSLTWNTGGSPDYYVATAQTATASVSTLDGSYTTSYTTSGGHTLTSPSTYSWSYSNTLSYSWSSSGSVPSSFGVSWQDSMGGSYTGSVSGQSSYSNIQIGSSSTSPSLPVGSGMAFAWSATPPSGYSVSPSSGTFSSTGSTTLSFSLITYTDTFQESGLPSGTQWGVTLHDGTNYHTTGTSLSVNFNVNTQQTYTVQGVSGYSITSGSTGTLTGGTTSVTYAVVVNTDTFSQTGLKAGTQWGVYGNNSWHYSTTSSLTFTYLGTGPFNYTVQNLNNYTLASTATGNLTTSSNVAVTYSPITYYTYFDETGLNTGTSWNVVFNSHAFSSSTSSIRVPWNVVNASSYTVSNVSGYLTPSPSTGTLNTTATRDVSFTKIAGTINYTETGLPNGTTWGMNFNGTQKYATAGSTISFTEPTGTFVATPSTNDSYWYSPFYNNNGSNPIYTFPIALSGVPSGTGYYQQLVTVNDPSHYGINSNGSNILFTAPNGTKLYAWEQSVNSSEIQVWIKNFNGSSQISMEVMPSFENLFNASGYLGYSNTTFNAPLVFGQQNASLFSGVHGTSGSPWDAANFQIHNGGIFEQNGLVFPSTNPTSSFTYGFYSNSSYTAGTIITSAQFWNSTTGYSLFGFGTTANFWGVLFGSQGNGFGMNIRNTTNQGSNYNGLTLHNQSEIYTLSMPSTSPSSSSTVSVEGGNAVTGSNPSDSIPSAVIGGWNAYGSPYEMIFHYIVVANANIVSFSMPTASISSYSVSVTGNATYNIDFSQYRFTTHFIPSGTDNPNSFWVKADGQNVSGSSSDGVDITQTNNTSIAYVYGTAATAWFSPSPGSGTAVYSGNLTVEVGFTQIAFRITVTESGLPSGDKWTVYVGSAAYSSTTNTIQFTSDSRTVSFNIAGPSGYYVTPHPGWSGNVNANTTVAFAFQGNGGGTNYVKFSPWTVIALVLAIPTFLYYMLRRKWKEMRN